MSDASRINADPYRWAGNRTYPHAVDMPPPLPVELPPPLPLPPPVVAWRLLTKDGDRTLELLYIDNVPKLYRICDGRSIVAAGEWK